MEESHYRALLDEVRSDIAEAERNIAELSNLEEYLLKKVGSGGGSSSSKASAAKSSASRGASRISPKADTVQEDSGSIGKGMQTVEFGPDGFPST